MYKPQRTAAQVRSFGSLQEVLCILRSCWPDDRAAEKGARQGRKEVSADCQKCGFLFGQITIEKVQGGRDEDYVWGAVMKHFGGNEIIEYPELYPLRSEEVLDGTG